MDAQRELRVAVVAAAVGYLATAAFWVAQAPGGYWVNRMFDFVMWNENDPGGDYIPAAHELLDHPGRSCFAGHPGIPLVFILSAEQHLYHGMARLLGSPLAFTPFIARNTVPVWVAAKLTIAVVQLASFLALYQFARIVLRRRDLALMAVGVYLTSFPAAYYQTRVSVEPLVNLFFLGTLVCLAKAGDGGAGSTASALRWAAAAGFLAVSAFFSKIHIMAVWPVFAGVWLLTTVAGGPGHWVVRRVSGSLAYLVGCLAAAALWEPFTDWESLRSVWEGTRADASGLSIFQFFTTMIGRVGGGVIAAFSQLHILNVLPAANRSTGFFYFEFLFLVAALAGLVVFFRGAGAKERRVMLWSLAYGLGVVVLWFYRSFGTDFHGFHYLFPVVAVLAPLAVLGLAILMPGVADPSRPRAERALHMGAAILVLHSAGLLAVFHSKCQDLLSYRETGAPYYQAALRKLSPGERIAVIGKSPLSFHGLDDTYALDDRRSTLVKELADLYLEPSRPHDVPALAADLQGRQVGWVIDFTLADPGPWRLEDWRKQVGR